jgi:hypothetical protein
VGGGDGVEPRRRRERCRSKEESKTGESMSSSTEMGNRYSIFLDGEGMIGDRGSTHIGRKGHGQHRRE